MIRRREAGPSRGRVPQSFPEWKMGAYWSVRNENQKVPGAVKNGASADSERVKGREVGIKLERKDAFSFAFWLKKTVY